MYPQPAAILAVGWDSVILKSLCMNWSKIEYEIVKLGDVSSQVRGVSYNGDEASDISLEEYLPILRANNITDNGIDFSNLVYVPQKRVSENQKIIKGDIIIAASSGSIQVVGKAASAKDDWIGSFGAFCKAIRPTKTVNSEYIGFYFKTHEYRLIISSLAAGANINNLRNEHLDNLQIPLPSLEVQQQIAALLDRADTLRQLDRQLLTHYDTLIQSVFLEMFGDPVKNEKGWEVKKLGDILDFMTSGSRGWAEYYSNSGSLFLRIQNVGYNRLKMNEIAFVNPPNTAEAKRTKVCEGDILLSITADLGRTAVIPKNFGEAYISQHLALLRPEREINSFFISELLASDFGQRQFKSANKGGVKAGLNFNDIKAINILLPPLAHQQRFADIVEKIEAQKATAAAQAEASEALFQGLLQKAFGKH